MRVYKWVYCVGAIHLAQEAVIGESNAQQFVNLPMETFPLLLLFSQSHIAMLVYSRYILCANFAHSCGPFFVLCTCS